MSANLKDYLNEQPRGPAFQAECDALEPEFAAIQAMIDARRASKPTVNE